MSEKLSSYDWEAECNELRERLCYTTARLDECKQLLDEMTKKHEYLKDVNAALEHELWDCRGKIYAFEFVITNGR